MMKWLAGALVAANVVLYLWAAGGSAPPGAPAPVAVADVNADAMRLVHEIPPAAESDAADAADAAVASADSAGAATVPQGGINIQPSGLDSQPAARSCHRIGPFKGGDAWDAAERWMRAQGFDYRAVRSARRATQVVRVYLGPFDSRAAAAPTLAWLQESELEHFVEADSAGRKTVISLGYFTQAALAEKYIAHLRARNIAARARRDYRDIGPHDWF
ncbi:MAG: SPOR domain-containing protein, partial [Gammaproteobacteria bacterium]|nr:SPOR domain-containing protein [Gammaproteobacteria bacterium]